VFVVREEDQSLGVKRTAFNSVPVLADDVLSFRFAAASDSGKLNGLENYRVLFCFFFI
jgi:hypothetical protein